MLRFIFGVIHLDSGFPLYLSSPHILDVFRHYRKRYAEQIFSNYLMSDMQTH